MKSSGLRGAAGRAALAAAATLATAAVLEGALRVAGHLDNRGLLGAWSEGAPPAPWSRVTLGQMIRRSPHPRIIYELRPGLRVLYAEGRVTTNGHGFRSPERDVAKPGGTFRVLGLGDSYMFGQGVSDDEAYLAVLERALARRDPARRWEGVNTAVPGYNTAMQVATLEEKGLAWSPDVIVVEVVGNDFDLPNFIRTPRDPTSLRRSFLADFVRGRLRRLGSSPAQPEGLTAAPEEPIPGGVHFLDDPERVPPEYRGMVGLAAWERAMEDLAAIGRRTGIPVVVMTQGVSFDRRLWRTATRLGMHYLDLHPALRGWLRANGYAEYARSPLVVRQDDPHPSRLGHELVAKELVGFLETKGLLPSTRTP